MSPPEVTLEQVEDLVAQLRGGPAATKARRKQRERFKTLAQIELQRYNAETPRERLKNTNIDLRFERKILEKFERRKTADERRKTTDEARRSLAEISRKFITSKEEERKLAEAERKLTLAGKLLLERQKKEKRTTAAYLRIQNIFLWRIAGSTLKEVGIEHGVTRERIRQIYTKELRRIGELGRDSIIEIMDDNKHKGRPFWHGLI